MFSILAVAYVAVGIVMVALTWRTMFDEEGLDGDFTLSYVMWTVAFWPFIAAAIFYLRVIRNRNDAPPKAGA